MSQGPFPHNPYVIGVPLTGEAGFYGRRAVFTFVQDTLEAEQQRVIVLYGQRRVGKTSLLHQLARRVGLLRPEDARDLIVEPTRDFLTFCVMLIRIVGVICWPLWTRMRRV